MSARVSGLLTPPVFPGRTGVRLHFFDGLSLRQVAGRLSLSYDKVRDRYAAGMRRLERELGSLQ